ncbi:hypothetical protein JAN5088_02317 [Jannaschia rubra]|uniref:Uncharacterized protein n=1 Tax=Jannaschia rubra TaxID=282197 RepID=A0A0M6XTM6_9RHOB|nr:hypothetical protein JAN5088_02317 [Jannaschia rubra]SFG03387.1 hypothetical protein SAMN04488517_102364 [Jannaschia rubra]
MNSRLRARPCPDGGGLDARTGHVSYVSDVPQDDPAEAVAPIAEGSPGATPLTELIDEMEEVGHRDDEVAGDDVASARKRAMAVRHHAAFAAVQPFGVVGVSAPVARAGGRHVLRLGTDRLAVRPRPVFRRAVPDHVQQRHHDRRPWPDMASGFAENRFDDGAVVALQKGREGLVWYHRFVLALVGEASADMIHPVAQMVFSLACHVGELWNRSLTSRHVWAPVPVPFPPRLGHV